VIRGEQKGEEKVAGWGTGSPRRTKVKKKRGEGSRGVGTYVRGERKEVKGGVEKR